MEIGEADALLTNFDYFEQPIEGLVASLAYSGTAETRAVQQDGQPQSQHVVTEEAPSAGNGLLCPTCQQRFSNRHNLK